MPETAPELRPTLTVQDPDGILFHATNQLGDRLRDWQAERITWGHVTYRRQVRVTFPRYSKRETITAAVDAVRRPWERLHHMTGDYWGGDDVAVTFALVFPSSSWCMECGHDVRPDEYGRVSPYAVYRDPRGRSLPPSRNLDHATAHQLAAAWLAEADDGRTAHVGIDACG